MSSRILLAPSPLGIAAALYLPPSLLLAIDFFWKPGPLVAGLCFALASAAALILLYWLHALAAWKYRTIVIVLGVYLAINAADFATTFWDPIHNSFSVGKARSEESNPWFGAILSAPLPVPLKPAFILIIKLASIAAFGGEMSILVGMLDRARAQGWRPAKESNDKRSVRGGISRSLPRDLPDRGPEVVLPSPEWNRLVGSYVFSVLGVASNFMALLALVANIAYEGEQAGYWNAELLFSLLPPAKWLTALLGIGSLLLYGPLISYLGYRRAKRETNLE